MNDNMITELKQKRAALIGQMREILTEAEAESRDLTAEENQEYDRIETDVNALAARIHRLEEQERRELELVVREAGGQPGTFDPRQALGEVKPAASVLASKEYREAFFSYLAVGKSELEPEQRLVLNHGFMAADQAKGTNKLGGFTVPTSMEPSIIDHLVDSGAMRRVRTNKIRTDAGEDLLVPKGTQHVTAEWLAEGVAATAVTEEFGQATLSAHKNVVLIRVPVELLTDNAVGLEDYLAAQIGGAMGRNENTAFVSGNGTGKPKGVDQDSVQGKVAASATAITADEVIDLVHSVIPAYRANGEFLMNDATIAAIRKLKDTTNQYLWQPALTAGNPDRLLGYPVFPDPDVATIAATKKVIFFGDFNAYWIRDVGGFVMRRLEERFAEAFLVGLLGYNRVDGELVGDPNAIKHLRTL